MQGRRGILTITTDTGEVYYQYITKKEAKARRCGGFETLNIPDREIYNSSSIDVKDTLKVERPKLIKSVKMRYNDGITRIDTEGIIEGKVYLG